MNNSYALFLIPVYKDQGHKVIFYLTITYNNIQKLCNFTELKLGRHIIWGRESTNMHVLIASFPFRGDDCCLNLTIVTIRMDDCISETTIHVRLKLGRNIARGGCFTFMLIMMSFPFRGGKSILTWQLL